MKLNFWLGILKASELLIIVKELIKIIKNVMILLILKICCEHMISPIQIKQVVYWPIFISWRGKKNFKHNAKKNIFINL